MRLNPTSILKVIALAFPAFFALSIFWIFGARELVVGPAILLLPLLILAWILSKRGWPIYKVGYACTLIPFFLLVGCLTVLDTDLILKDQGQAAFRFSDLSYNAPLLLVFMSLGFTAAYIFRRTT